MENVPRNVILDLLPAYIAGEVSEETRALVEEFAQKDPEIARLIHTGVLDLSAIPPKLVPPDDLEMKTIKRIRRSIHRQMWYVALTTASILLVPFVAMQFTDQVNWSAFDFVAMGILLFVTGFAYVLISNISDSRAYRTAVGVAVVTSFLLIWVNLAVGIIGSEDNPANQLYAGVIAVGIIGAGISRFKPRGMAHTLFATAFAQLLVPVIALIIWKPALEMSSSLISVFILNAYFALLFFVSALLFQKAAREQPTTREERPA